MFARNTQNNQKPVAAEPQHQPAPQSTNPAASMIGADVKIVGNSTVVSQSQIQIDGIVDGEIRGKDVRIGNNGKITGEINAHAIDVRGAVEGTLRGNAVTLQNTARVSGDIHHQTIAIAEGALFDGLARPTNNAAELTPNLASSTAAQRDPAE